MGHLRSLSVLALGITASGCVVLFDDDDATDPPAPPPVLESSQFLPLLCTSGIPGGSQCPINTVDLGDLGPAGTFGFVLQAVGSGLYFNQLRFTAGTEGLYLERPTLRVWVDKSPSSELPFDTLNIPPGMSETPGGGTATLAFSAGVSAFSLRFDAIGPHRP